MTSTPIYKDQNFYAPRFEIKLRGQNLSRSVIRDVVDVSYTDNLEKLDSFEFTLNDWDPIQRLPKYSSPYDEGGSPRTLADGKPVPNFDPGAKIELQMGYYGPKEPPVIMTGEVVSLSPSFPSSGNPTLKVRALNLLYTLQKKQEVAPFENKKDSEIAEAIGSKLGIAVEIPKGQKDQEQAHEYIMVNNEYPIIFLRGRARRLGYDLFIKLPEDNKGAPKLFFGRTPSSQTVYEITWGESLIQFSPTVKTKGQVTKVVVRGWNPKASGKDRIITGEATIQDLNPKLPDSQLLSSIDSALAQTHEIVVDDPITSKDAAKKKALGILKDNWKSLVTGKGQTVGLPDLRAGRTVVLKGLGARYSGRYLVTETIHKISGSGYTTDFSARLEGPA